MRLPEIATEKLSSAVVEATPFESTCLAIVARSFQVQLELDPEVTRRGLFLGLSGLLLQVAPSRTLKSGTVAHDMSLSRRDDIQVRFVGRDDDRMRPLTLSLSYELQVLWPPDALMPAPGLVLLQRVVRPVRVHEASLKSA